MTGLTAGSNDFIAVTTARLPIVFGFVLTLAFILLLVTFRSIVVPLKAIVLNLLSVGAAYGVLVLVFQDGHGEQLLNFQSVGGIAPCIPLFLFVILFGLSMDYHVFILSRIREAVDRGMTPTTPSPRHQGHRRRRDERRARDGRGLRRLRPRLRPGRQADRRRPRCSDPDRRDADPRGPAAGQHEAARRPQLVPPHAPELASEVAHEPEVAPA